MIRLGKQVLCLILFLNVLCIGSNVIAHPHVFIVQRLNIVFDNKGLAGFWVEWNFDEMFSIHTSSAYITKKNIAARLPIYTIHPILSSLSIVSIMHGLLLSQGRFQPSTWLSSCFHDPGVNQN